MLKHLSQVEMLGLSSSWVGEHRALFLSIAEIAALHPQIVQIHEALVAALPQDPSKSPELRAILDEATEVDVLHDALVRAIIGGVEADRLHSLASTPPDTQRVGLAQKTLELLFPQGLAVVNASLVAESGHTERAAARLENEPEIQEFLESIPVREGSLLDVTGRWLDTGKKLGELERARNALLAGESTEVRDAVRLNQLRGAWIQRVALVLASLRVSKADPTAIETIRRPVVEASARAGKRYAVPRVVDVIEIPEEPEEEEVPGDSDALEPGTLEGVA